MDKVDLSKLVVSYRSIEKRLVGGLEAVASPGTGQLEASDDLEKAAFIAAVERARVEIQVHTKVPTVFVAPDHGMASLILSYNAREAAQQGKVIPAPDGGFESKFDDKDIGGWLKSVFTWWRGLRKAHFIGSTPIAEPARSNDLRIALMGDWGTNMYGAPVCAASIRRASPAYDMVMHLGDVYYSGMEDECQTRLIAPWPKVPGAISRALNANHEMYTGGHSYFGKILPAFEQTASYFATSTDHFLLVGLDTGYDEHDLAGNQVGWLEALLRDAGDRKVILFSHHQPFSVFEKQGTKLVSKLRTFIDEGRIFAWYWGHEHRCVIYDRSGYGFWGRCIGHSGYPYFRQAMTGYTLYKTPGYGVNWYSIAATENSPVAHILDGPNPYVTEAPAEYGAQGYASLELRGPELHEKVHLPDGSVIYEHQLA